MAITHIQHAQARTTSLTTTTATFATTPVAGNLLIASFSSNNTGALAPFPGWTLLVSHAGTVDFISIYLRIAGASEPTAVSYTPAAGTGNDLQINEFSGLTVPSLDSTGVTDSGSTTSLTASSGATSALAGTGDLVYTGIFTSNQPSLPITYTNGFTQIQQSPRQVSAWKVATDRGSQSTALSWSTTNVKSCAAIVAISPVSLAVSFSGWGVPL